MSKPFVERNDYWFYAITCKDEDISDSYIGSTKKWGKRKNKHKSKCRIGSDEKVYRYINEYGGWNNWSMDKIGFQENLTRLEARIIEDILIEEFGTLNDKPAYKSSEEIKNYRKLYSKQEHARISKRLRNGRKVQCECGMTIRYDSFARHRESAIHNKRLNEQK